MNPSLFSYAIVRAFDPETPPTASKEEFAMQCELFNRAVEPFLPDLSALVADAQVPSRNRQKLFDALVSVAHDASPDVLFSSDLPEVLKQRHSKRMLRDAFEAIPSFYSVMRPDVEATLANYRMPLMERRYYEYFLATGCAFLMIGRTRLDGEIVYSPHALHPLLQWLYYR